MTVNAELDLHIVAVVYFAGIQLAAHYVAYHDDDMDASLTATTLAGFEAALFLPAAILFTGAPSIEIR